MPRRPRFSSGGYVYHVLNRAVGRRTIFHTDKDYAAFLQVLEAARHKVPMRLLSFAIMPNHWHLVLWPIGDGDLSNYMQWLTMTHTQRWHALHATSGTGPLYQGRFKSFPVQDDDHFLTVCRYVERNPLRANLTTHAQNWQWSSLWQHVNERFAVSLDTWPVPQPAEWLAYVNRPETEAELAAIRNSVRRGAPFGDPSWRAVAAKQLGLESTLTAPGRPRKR